MESFPLAPPSSSLRGGGTDPGEEMSRMVSEHVFRGRRGAAADASTSVTSAAERALRRSSGRAGAPAAGADAPATRGSLGGGSAADPLGSARPPQMPPSLAAEPGHAVSVRRAAQGRAAPHPSSSSAPVLPVSSVRPAASLASSRSALSQAITDRTGSRPRFARTRLRTKGKIMRVEDMEGARKLPRGAALARAAAVASDKLAVSGAARPPDSSLRRDALRDQNIRVAGARLGVLRREMQDLRTGGLGGGTPKSILDPEIDMLLATLPPVGPRGRPPKVDKLTGVPPRLLGSKLTPLEREEQATRLSRPASDGTGAAVRAGRRVSCALCQHPFARVNLVTPVTRKAVFGLMRRWGSDPVETFGTPALRLGEAPACYEVVRVCRFCTQFFEAAVAEGDRKQLSAEGDTTMA